MTGRAPAAGAPIVPEQALPALDWTGPWLRPFASLQTLLAERDWREALSREARDRGVVSGRGRPLRFVGPQAAGAVAYESYIAATGCVPTRANLHDAFNALCWLRFPLAKAALNARQADEIDRSGVGPVRGAVRDAATLIDESGLLLAADDPAVFAALAAHDWRKLLVQWRGRWGHDIVAHVFGHALLEKLAGPFKAITACVVPLPGSAAADTSAAAFFGRADLAPALLPHLPVLGIPGWCAENADPAFYGDARVFRPPRRAQ